MKKFFILIVAVLAILTTGETLVAQDEKKSDKSHMMGSKSMSNPSAELRTAMRKLWEDHVTWTRNVILCLVDDLPGTDQAVARLLRNQDDIGNAIKPYYGDAAGNKLGELLHEHINVSADVVKAAKASDNTALDAANKKWFANADEISEFLSNANPNWKLEDMKGLSRWHMSIAAEKCPSSSS